MSPFLGYLRLKFDKKAVNWFKNIPGVTKHFARGLQYGSGRVIQSILWLKCREFSIWSNKTTRKTMFHLVKFGLKFLQNLDI